MSVVGEAAAAAAAVRVSIRPFRADDDASVRALFWATLAGGSAAPFDRSHEVMRAYEHLCLDWYLTTGARWASVVVDDDDHAVGYALVCCDERSARRAVVTGSARFVAAACGAVVRGRLDPAMRTFVRLRFRDAAALARSGRHDVPSAHAHLNLTGAARNTSAVLAVRARIDEVVLDAGHGGWSGEINTRHGRRAGALGRSGFEVVGREPNHTLGWLAGEPVDRLTVVRRLR
ncbi:MAG: hypothetical protein RIB65_12830 [Ilumatobacter fluminis]|uniref:hypothetical protein n=1 Tax=Ilumatobacter fluminis TaxID=467091 RepID=UPI0032EF1BFE